MANPRKRSISDEDIAELYRNSLFNPGRFAIRIWDGIDYVTSRRFALRLTFVLTCSVVVLIIGWAIRWLTNADLFHQHRKRQNLGHPELPGSRLQSHRPAAGRPYRCLAQRGCLRCDQ